jgi:hypothetical protein
MARASFKPLLSASRVRSPPRSAGVCCWLAGFRFLAVAQEAYRLREDNEPDAISGPTRLVRAVALESGSDQPGGASARLTGDPFVRMVINQQVYQRGGLRRRPA